MKSEKDLLFCLIKASLWGTDAQAVGQDEYVEMKAQALIALPSKIISLDILSKELYEIWKQSIIQQAFFYTNYIYEQSRLPISVPYVILKGTSAAQYYPYPECRVMGDIDIMTRREDYAEACSQLAQNGYIEIIPNEGESIERHRCFKRNGIMIEVHRYFALLNNPAEAKWLDDLLVENITSTHVLPDLINGLVLLEHISQHMEDGLGLRQIVDWMMFVDKCLPDGKWPDFEVLAKEIGLCQLAIVATRMCELYLGLPERNWCAEADEQICVQLMDYIFECGNFGQKRITDKAIIEKVLTRVTSIKTAIKVLQERGMVNWKAAQRNGFLRCFAWCYQIVRYLRRGLGRGISMEKIKDEYLQAKKRRKMFDMLGIRVESKGIVIYKNGDYKKM